MINPPINMYIPVNLLSGIKYHIHFSLIDRSSHRPSGLPDYYQSCISVGHGTMSFNGDYTTQSVMHDQIGGGPWSLSPDNFPPHQH